jgi:ABC-2 type transport system ATP-binding protein
MPSPAIAVKGLSFEYPGVRALDDVSCEIATGSVTALVGPNGAGKTTLLRCIAGLDRPMLGAVRVAGVDVLEAPRAAHRKIGFLSDSFGLYESLSVRRCFMHAAAANGVPQGTLAATVERVAARLEIADKLDVLAGELSRGQRQRVAIGQAISRDPEVLLLDEPASGLDPEARAALAGLFKILQAQGVTLLVSSHILAELDEYSTDMLVLRAGRIIEGRALHRKSELRKRLRLELSAAVAGLRERLAACGVDVIVEADDRSALLELAGGPEAHARLLAGLVAAGLPVCAFAEVREDLQASYLRTVQKNGGAAAA